MPAMLLVLVFASVTLLTPAFVYAQDDVLATPTATLEVAGPGPNETPEPADEPAVVAEPDEQAGPGESPAEPEGTAAEDPTPRPEAPEPESTKTQEEAIAEPVLFVHPDGLVLFVGESARLSAWTCDRSSDGPARGADRQPGTTDDSCSPAIGAEWSIRDGSVASFGEVTGNEVQITADAESTGTRIIATLDGLKARVDLVVEAAPEALVEERAARFEPAGGPEPAAEFQPAANAFNVTPASQTVASGSTTDYTWLFTATNAGATQTTTFTIPAGWTAPSAAAGPGQVIVTAGTCSASLASVVGQVVTIDQGPGTGTCGNGQTFTLQYLEATAPTPASPPQVYTFANQHGNSPTVTVTGPVSSADLSVTKSDSPDPVLAGGTLTYTIVVSNAGPSAAETVTLSDTFPAQLTDVTVVDAGPYTCGVVGQVLSCTIASHPVGVDATITVTATVDPATVAGTTISNTAGVDSATDDPVPANDSATATTTVAAPASADLSVTKSARPSSLPEPGGTVSFSVLIENPSPTTALTITSIVDSVYGDLDGRGDCSVPQPIAGGASYSCTFSAEVTGNAGFVETNVVTASGTDALGATVTASDDASVTITDVLPDIAVTKTASPSQLAAPGGDVTYTVRISNLVSEPVEILAIEDDKLGNLGAPGNSRVSVNTCDNAIGFVLPVGATALCTFTARLEGQAGDTHVNTVTVTVSDDDDLPSTQPARLGLAAVNVVSVSASATVTFISGEQGGGAGGGQPPTDMLLASDGLSGGVGGPFGDAASWALWALLSSAVILMTGWVIRRQRLGRV
jgi:uncharacterized repeat protein (TIGR01451 family)